MKRLLIIGAGGFGREVVAIVAAINAVQPAWELVGVLDDSAADSVASDRGPGVDSKQPSVPVLGGVGALSTLTDHHAVIAVGSPTARAMIAAAHPRQKWATLVHPDTTIASDSRIGVGSVVAPGARISTNCTLGEHVHVDQNVTVGHDSTVSAYVRLNPQACISGSVTLEQGVLIGANATVLQGLTIGSGSTVGAGAVVVRNVADAVTVKGVPAR